MGIDAISFSIALLLVSHAVSSPAVVKGAFGASVSLPCDGPAYPWGTPYVQLDVLWRTSEGKKVARYSHGAHSVGLQFERRVTFPTQRIRQGDYSINISSVTFRDEDSYECVWKKYSDEIVLNDVRLYVLEPPFSKSFSVHVGDPVTLPCYGHINKDAPEASFVQWKKGNEPVLRRSPVEVTYGPKYKERASVSPDWIHGDFSLSLKATGVCDSGDYQCSTDQNASATSVILELKDYRHYKPVNLGLGTTFSLSLPREPVNVIFSNESTLPKVPLCSVDTGGFKCEPKYRVLREWKNLTVTSDDVGTYTVIHSSNCVISHAYRVNIKHDRQHYYLFVLLLFPIAVLCILCILYCMHGGRSNDSGHKNSSESVSNSSQDDFPDKQVLL